MWKPEIPRVKEYKTLTLRIYHNGQVTISGWAQFTEEEIIQALKVLIQNLASIPKLITKIEVPEELKAPSVRRSKGLRDAIQEGQIVNYILSKDAEGEISLEDLMWIVGEGESI